MMQDISNSTDEFAAEPVGEIYSRIIEDDTRWDYMTGKELEKRIAAFQSDARNSMKLIEVISCLRLTEVIYLRKKEKNGWTCPVLHDEEGNTVLLFTAKKHIQGERFKEYKPAKANYSSIIEGFSEHNVKNVIINIDTQNLLLPIENISGIIKVCDNLQKTIDQYMESGIQEENLEEIIFERFKGRRIYCKFKDGKTIEADSYSYFQDKERGGYLVADTDKEKELKIYKKDVSFIKDITF